MTTFLLYTLLVICLGIFVRIFWIPLLVIGSVLVTALGIIISSGITAAILVFIKAMCSQGDLSGFSTYFAYSAIFYVVMTFIYVSAVGDLVKITLNLLKR